MSGQPGWDSWSELEQDPWRNQQSFTLGTLPAGPDNDLAQLEWGDFATPIASPPLMSSLVLMDAGRMGVGTHDQITGSSSSSHRPSDQGSDLPAGTKGYPGRDLDPLQLASSWSQQAHHAHPEADTNIDDALNDAPTLTHDPWAIFEKDPNGTSAKATHAPPETSAGEHAWPYMPKANKLDPASAKSKIARPSQSRSPRPARDENVIFDAEDLTDTDESHVEDDDFGDFETGATHAYVAQLEDEAEVPGDRNLDGRDHIQLSLIDLEETLPSFSPTLHQVHHTSVSHNEATNLTFDPFAEIESQTPRRAPSDSFESDREVTLTDERGTNGNGSSVKKGSSSGVTHSSTPGRDGSSTLRLSRETAIARPLEPENEGWESWDDQVAGGGSLAPKRPAPTPSSPILLRLLKPDPAVLTATPPSNMPPPALILSLFPPIIADVKARLLDYVNEATAAHQAVISSTPNARLTLDQYLIIATVLARIIAGRKLRWKRDTLLSQSMSIGHAMPGGGMKLTSVDRSESVREEREVTVVVSLWKGQLGKLKSTLTRAGVQTAIPDVALALPVRTAQAFEGAVMSSRACSLCALKRNERIQKVDLDVQDSFGEWWTEHWGHRSCRDFWNSYEEKLVSR